MAAGGYVFPGALDGAHDVSQFLDHRREGVGELADGILAGKVFLLDGAGEIPAGDLFHPLDHVVQRAIVADDFETARSLPLLVEQDPAARAHRVSSAIEADTC